MGLLDDAIREHLELKRRHGADPTEVARQEREALGSGRVPPAATDAPEPAPESPDPIEPDEPSPALDDEVPAAPSGGAVSMSRAAEIDPEPDLDWSDPVPLDDPEPPAASAAQDEDVLEETPEFLQETPEHDRLWFEQRPPKDFDF